MKYLWNRAGGWRREGAVPAFRGCFGGRRGLHGSQRRLGTLAGFISHQVFLKSFCKGQLPQKSANPLLLLKYC